MSTVESLTANLNIAERLTAAWRLLRVSAGVVRREPALIGVTLLGGFVGIALPLLFILGVGALLAPAAVSDLFAGQVNSGAVGGLVLSLIVGYVLYGLVFSGVINAFFGGATAEIAMRRIEGKNPSLGDGLGAASKRFGALAIFGVIGGIVRSLTSGGSASGGISMGDGVGTSGIDTAANAARAAAAELYRLLTCLSLPAIMREPIGGASAISRSTEIMRRVWPQAIASGYGIRAITRLVGSVFGLVLFAVVGLTMFNLIGGAERGTVSLVNNFGGGSFGADSTSPVGLFGSLFDSLFGSLAIPSYVLPTVIICLLAMRIISTIGALLEAVYNGALYLYATTGRAGEFDATDLARAAVTSDGVVKPGAAKA